MGSTRARAVCPAPPRKLAFRWSPLMWRIERRKAQLCRQWRVPLVACDSDLRCAHAFRRSIATFLFPGPCFRVLGTGIVPVIRPAFASLHPHPSSRKRQSPVVGPDGYPGPPESVLARHVRGRRTLSHLQRRPREAPSLDRVIGMSAFIGIMSISKYVVKVIAAMSKNGEGPLSLKRGVPARYARAGKGHCCSAEFLL
jgi:hypothetical protein